MTALFDTRTLLMVITIVLISRALILSYVWHVSKRYPPLTLWAAGSSLLAAGALLVALRGMAPDILSIVMAQTLIVTGWMLNCAGIVLAAEQPPPWRTGILVTTLAVAATAWYALAVPDFTARTIATSLASIAFDLYGALACLRFRGSARRTTLRLLAGVLILEAASNILKLGYYVTANTGDVFVTAWQVGQFFIVSILAIVIGSVIFVLLAAQRLQEELDCEILEHRKDQQTIARSEAKYRHLYEATSDAVMILDQASSRFTGCNASTLRMFGCGTEEEFCAYSPAALSPPRQPCGTESAVLAQKHIESALSQGRQDFEWVHRRADNGELFTTEVHLNTVTLEGKITLQATARDITERKRIEDSIRQLAFIDALTQLPNRRLLVDRLAMAMAASKRTSTYCCLLFLDLDNFKPLNDKHGHDVGDLLLIEVAGRLRGAVRAMDTVARLGGDEFVVLIGELSSNLDESRNAAEAVAGKILALLSLPYLLHISGENRDETIVEHRCSASIGVALFCGEELSREEILKRADAAMYAAKHAGRQTVRFFDDTFAHAGSAHR